MPTGISYAVSAMEMVELLLWNVGNDMHCARHLSTYALVLSNERMQNVSKERGEGDVLAAVERSPSIGRISRTTDVDRHRYGEFYAMMVSVSVTCKLQRLLPRDHFNCVRFCECL